MIIYQEFLAKNIINEMAAFDPDDKLRWAVHEIIINLKEGQTIKFSELSKKLKEYNIDISEEILKKIFEDWDRVTNPDYSIFKKEDKNWMDVWIYQNNVKRKLRDKQSFGKHRKKSNNVYYPPAGGRQNYYGWD